MNAGADRLRPEWASLPVTVRTQIISAIGGQYVSDAPAHGGFSAAYAGVVSTTAGRAFVKACAAEWHADSQRFLRQEGLVLARLPDPLGPRMIAAIDSEDGVALVLEAVDGHHPGAPWTHDDLHAIARNLRTVATTAAPIELAPAEESMIPDYTRWGEIARDEHLRAGLPSSVQTRMHDLTRIEQDFAEAVRGDRVVHDDVRADNILISGGRAQLLDWPHARRGAAWIDLAFLLPSVEATGGPRCEDAWTVFAEHGAPAQDSLLPVASGFASYLWHEQAQPEIPQLPGLRAFQRAQAIPALRWVSGMLT